MDWVANLKPLLDKLTQPTAAIIAASVAAIVALIVQVLNARMTLRRDRVLRQLDQLSTASAILAESEGLKYTFSDKLYHLKMQLDKFWNNKSKHQYSATKIETPVFSAYSTQIGVLPADLVSSITFTYRMIEVRLNEYAEELTLGDSELLDKVVVRTKLVCEANRRVSLLIEELKSYIKKGEKVLGETHNSTEFACNLCKRTVNYPSSRHDYPSIEFDAYECHSEIIISARRIASDIEHYPLIRRLRRGVASVKFPRIAGSRASNASELE